MVPHNSKSALPLGIEYIFALVNIFNIFSVSYCVVRLEELYVVEAGPNYPYNGWQKWVADERNTWDRLAT